MSAWKAMSHRGARPTVTARAKFMTGHPADAVSRLSRAVTGPIHKTRDKGSMTNHDFLADRTELERLVETASHAEVDAFLGDLHVKYHDRPGDHVRVHLAWMRVHSGRGSYLRALGHAFAGLIVAGPSSLVQRYTGLVAPAFDAERRS
jgi:hypothetical protein